MMACLILSRMFSVGCSHGGTPVISPPAAEESATITASAPTSPSVSPGSSALQNFLDGYTPTCGGKWDIRVESLATGETAQLRKNLADNDTLVSASLIKLFIMGAVYERVNAGALAQRDVRDALEKMITISDNNSANKLVLLLGSGDKTAGLAAVNAFAAAIGCPDSQQNRLMLENNGLQNYTTGSDCAKILRLIYEGKCVSEEYSAEMLSLLKAQTVNDRIPAEIPLSTVIAHKTGDLSGLSCGDVGIVFSPGGDYIICAICNAPAGDAAAADAIAALSSSVFSYFNS